MHVEAEIRNGIAIRAGIAQRDMFKGNTARHVLELYRAAVFFDRLVKRLENAFGSNRHPDDRSIDAGKTLERLQHKQHGRQESHEFAERQHAALTLPERKGEHDGYAHHADQLGGRRPDGGNLIDAKRKVGNLIIDFAEPFTLCRIGAGDFDKPLGFIGFLDAGQKRRHILLAAEHHRFHLS